MGKFSALEKCPLTKAWTIEERTALAHFMDDRRVKAGDPILSPQSKEQALFLIDSGTVRVSFENVHADLGEGETFGELSICMPTNRIATVIAQSDCRIWVLSQEKWNELKLVTPAVMLKLMEAITQKVSKLVSVTIPPTRMTQAGRPNTL